MTTPLGLAERVTALEYAVFEQIPATMAAMTHGATLIYQETVTNGQAIAGLRVDMGSLEATLHKEVADLKLAINLQGDRLHKELGAATSGFRADVTGLRELMDTRFQKVDGQFNAIRVDMDQRFDAVDQRFETVDQRFDAVDQRFETVDQRFDAVDQRFETVDQRFDAVDQRLDTLDAKLDTILSELRK
jgi:tetrahydromethanopterin S-methyltransferase subunit G